MYCKNHLLQFICCMLLSVATTNFATAQTQLIKSLKINNGGGGAAPTALWIKTPASGNVAADSLLTWSTTDSSVRKIAPFTDWYKFGSTVPAANADNQWVQGSVAIGQNSAGTVAGSGTTAAKFTVASGDANINTLTVGLGRGQVATNTAVGNQALWINTSGANNTALGYQSLDAVTTGAGNTGVGSNALGGTTGAGANNTALGYNAGLNITTGSTNIAIGSGQNVASATASNQLNIGGAIFGTGLSGTAGAPAGNIGIGTTTPGARLEVNNGTDSGAIKIVDGTQDAGKVLTSDSNGLATWQHVTLYRISGVMGNGVTIPLNAAGGLLPIDSCTGSYIDLPPGKWLVNVNMLMVYVPGTSSNGAYVWLRTGFSTSATTPPPEKTSLISGNITKPQLGTSYNVRYYNMMSGGAIINNTSTATVRYYYWAIAYDADVTTTAGATILDFGGQQWGENEIEATPVL